MNSFKTLWCLYCEILVLFTSFYSVSAANFENVNLCPVFVVLSVTGLRNWSE